jgi:ribosome-associated protein
LQIVDFISAKKAKDIVVLDLGKISGLCDYFIICSAESDRQVKAIYEEVAKRCKKSGIRISHAENDESGKWVLVDFFDIILHIFVEEARKFYNLEYLWSESRKIKLKK